MSLLNPHATQQAELDARSKISNTRTPAQSLFGWLAGQTWKMRFVVCTVVMFTGYAIIANLLALLGLRQLTLPDLMRPIASNSCERPGLSLSEKAACLNGRDDAAAAANIAARLEGADLQRAKAPDDQALAKERARQQADARLKALEYEFALRVQRLIDGRAQKWNGFDDMEQYREETLRVLLDYLVLNGHPMSRILGVRTYFGKVELLFRTSKEAEITPPGAEAVRDAVAELCMGRDEAGWRARCGGAVIKHVLQLPGRRTYGYLNHIFMRAGNPEPAATKQP